MKPAAGRSSRPRGSRRAAPEGPANETGTSSRAMWTGTLGFGLVAIPIRLFPRERSNDLAFHQIDRRNGSPIGYERVNKATGKPVEWKDIAKGYEIAKGTFVLVDDDDFAKANVAASQTIDIQDFVPAAEIAPEYFDKPYVLAPDKRGSKAYGVLRDALAKKKLAAVALFVLKTRQHLCAVFAEGDLLVLELLRFAHELRPAIELARGADIPAAKTTAREAALADQLVDQMVVSWDPGRYKDSYRDDLLAALHEKAEKGSIEPRNAPAASAPRGAIDLVDLLAQSVASAAKGHPSKKSPKPRSTGKSAGKRRAA